MSNIAIGIYLVGKNSYAAVFINSKVEIIPYDIGKKNSIICCFYRKRNINRRNRKNELKKNQKNAVFNVENKYEEKNEKEQLEKSTV
jgi:hypothetical protein